MKHFKIIFAFTLIVLAAACGKENWKNYQPPELGPDIIDPDDTVVVVPQGDTITLTVMSVGILHSSASLPRFAEIIDSMDVDLVLAREIDHDNTRSGKGIKQGEDLAALAQMNHFFAKAQDYKEGEYGISVLSRFPIEDTYTEIFTNKRPVGMITVKVNDTTTVKFAGVQFDDVNTATGASNRLIQAQSLLDVTKNIDGPILLAGNFYIQNFSTDPTLAKLNEQFTSACTNCGFTFPKDNPTIIADHIMYKVPNGLEVEVLKYVVLDNSPVNRLPVIAKIQIVL